MRVISCMMTSAAKVCTGKETVHARNDFFSSAAFVVTSKIFPYRRSSLGSSGRDCFISLSLIERLIARRGEFDSVQSQLVTLISLPPSEYFIYQVLYTRTKALFMGLLT